MARSEDSSATNQPWSDVTRPLARLVFPARHVAIALLAVSIPVVPQFGPHRWLLSALCVGVLLPLDLLMHWSTRRRGEFPRWMPFVNQCTATIVVAIEPAAFVPAIVLLLTDDALTAMVFGRAYALSAGFVGIGLMSGVAALHHFDAPVPPLVALGLGVCTMATILGGLADSERRLRARYRTLVSEVDVIVWELVPGSDRFSYVSTGATQLLGYRLADWYVPGFWTDHVHDDDRDRVLDELDAALASGVDHVLEYRLVHADGHAVHVRDVAAVELDAAGRVVNMRGVIMDISDVRRAEELLRERATHDVLTGLPNRGLLAERIDEALDASARAGDPVALLLLDLDDFKEVNDALGHHAGDRLLTAFADRLRLELADCDTIARLGGDEFAVLLTDGVTAESAIAVGRRVLAALEAPFLVDGLQLHTGASVGVALFPEHAADATDLQSRADVAMYLAKRSRKGVAQYEPGLDRSGVRRITLLAQLREALADDRIQVELQPWVELATGRVATVEAVLRWDNPDHGAIGSADFVQLADLAGLGEPLLRHVVEEALAALAATDLGVPLAVDAAARNLTDPAVVAWLERTVVQHRLAPGDLIVQVAGTALVEDLDPGALDAIRGVGIHVALDGFGNGDSVLAHLKRHRVDVVKVDPMFAAGVATDPAGAAIYEAIVELAHRLGVRVVAEGASTADDLDRLRRLGCDYVTAPADDLRRVAGTLDASDVAEPLPLS